MGGLTLGKLCFGKDGLQFGLELCLARAGLTAHTVTEETAAGCDILLVSICWYRDVYALERFMRAAKLRKDTRKPYILAGGMQATITPEAIARMVDAVFIGDGDDCLGELVQQISDTGDCQHPNVFHDGDNEVPAPRVCAPSAHTITTNDTKGTQRIEIARGCKYKCSFCALGHLKPYAEVSLDDLIPVMRGLKGKRCSFFAPERVSHSQWPEIHRAIKQHGCRDLAMDARLDHLQEVQGASVAFGLEGMSEKLRRSIGKPFSDDMIIERLGEFVRTRKRIARAVMYFIGDLPGEDASDWEAVWALFERINAEPWSRTMAATPALFPLTPKRCTALKDAHIHIFRDYGTKWHDLLTNHGKQWGFRITRTLVNGPMERTMDMLIERGGADAYDVIRCLPDKVLAGKLPVKEREGIARQILQTAERYGITQGQLEGTDG